MQPRARWSIVGVSAAFLIGGGFGPAGSTGKGTLTPSTCAMAANAALHQTGGGRVTGTEIDHGAYDVEVRLPDGRHVDIVLNKKLEFLGTEAGD
jgi:hypothetical protein